jgi:shikimate kinase
MRSASIGADCCTEIAWIRRMLILLVGPKGSGKSHVGRILERELGVHFFHVEPLWMRYREACLEADREATVAEGIAAVHPQLRAAVREHPHVCVETTGASPDILTDLMSLAPRADTLIVRMTSPLSVCLERIARRDPTHQIPVDLATCREIYELSTALELDADLVFDNLDLRDEQIVAAISPLLAGTRPGASG